MILQIALGLLCVRRSPNHSVSLHIFVAAPSKLWGVIRRHIGRRREARRLRELLWLNDHLLRDIGLRRDALFWEAEKRSLLHRGCVSDGDHQNAVPQRVQHPDAYSGRARFGWR